jgi:hypothetical protein
MPEKTCNVAQAVGFVSMDGGIVVVEGLFAGVGPYAVELAESLADEAVEVRIGTFLRTTFDDHVNQFDLGDQSKLYCI